MVEYLDVHPWIVGACIPFLAAIAFLLASIPRRIANWLMRKSEVQLELDAIELRTERKHTDIDRAHVERIRQTDEQRRAAGVVSQSIRVAALAKIEPHYRRQHEEADIDRHVEVRRRTRLLEASSFTRLFADDCQRRS